MRRAWIGLTLAGCLQPEHWPLPTEAELANTRSGVLFPKPIEGVAKAVAFDTTMPPRPFLLGLETADDAELWLYGCALDELDPPTPNEPLITPSDDCTIDGAPCPVRALHLRDGAWSPATPGRQPWIARGSTTACLELELRGNEPIPNLVRRGRPSFVAPLGPDHVLVGSNDYDEMDQLRGTLQVWPAPRGAFMLGPPIETHTSTIGWLGAVALPDGRAYLIGHSGATAIAELSQAGLVVAPDLRYPNERDRCVGPFGDEVATKGHAVGKQTSAGFEIWAINNCRYVFHRILGGPWEGIRVPDDDSQNVTNGEGGVVIVGPEEVLAAGVYNTGLLHYQNGRGRRVEVKSDLGPTVLAMLEHPSGPIYIAVPNIDGTEVMVQVEGGWRGFARGILATVFSISPAGDGLLIGNGITGAFPQYQDGILCPEAFHVPIDIEYMAFRVLVFNGHYFVIGLADGGNPVPARLMVFDQTSKAAQRCDQEHE